MNSKRNFSTSSILTVVLFLLSFLLVNGAAAAAPEEIVEIKGTVKAVSNKAKTVSVTVEGKGVIMLKFTEATEFVNAKSGGDIPPPTAVVVKYKTVGADNLATYIKKDLVQLPDGVAEIKTAELAALVAKGPWDGKYCLIDSRPAQVAAAGHLPTAATIPVNVLAEKGEKLLPCDKDKLLIFYCGGPT
ncbi:MAG: rhodanese-like domain-containing protein [Desulfobacteraceae bacterium]|nr:MAG: rhodanese-like domain-containing protein [Desulfobacteraceae bacterium]